MKRMNKVLAVILSLAMMITIAPANNGTSKARKKQRPDMQRFMIHLS
ncbi:MAG: hypothetical protein ACLTHH_08530 [Eubacterium sp.]